MRGAPWPYNPRQGSRGTRLGPMRDAEIDDVTRSRRNYIFGLRPNVPADRQLDLSLRQLADDSVAERA